MALAYAQILLKEAQQLPGSITNNDTTFFEALQTFAQVVTAHFFPDQVDRVELELDRMFRTPGFNRNYKEKTAADFVPARQLWLQREHDRRTKQGLHFHSAAAPRNGAHPSPSPRKPSGAQPPPSPRGPRRTPRDLHPTLSSTTSPVISHVHNSRVPHCGFKRVASDASSLHSMETRDARKLLDKSRCGVSVSWLMAFAKSDQLIGRMERLGAMSAEDITFVKGPFQVGREDEHDFESGTWAAQVQLLGGRYVWANWPPTGSSSPPTAQDVIDSWLPDYIGTTRCVWEQLVDPLLFGVSSAPAQAADGSSYIPAESRVPLKHQSLCHYLNDWHMELLKVPDPDATIHLGGLEGELESEPRIADAFAKFGTVLAATLRRRRGEKNGKRVVSWALVTFAYAREARLALAGAKALGVELKSPHPLVVKQIDTKQVLQSTGSMGDVMRKHQQRVQGCATALFKGVGIANLFLSHSLDNDFLGLAQSAERHCKSAGLAPDHTFCWVDGVCTSHHPLFTPEDHRLRFKKIVSRCHNTLAVITHGTTRWTERLWCILEAFETLAAGGKFSIGMSDAEAEKFDALMLEDATHLTDLVRAVDVRTAKAYVKEHKRAVWNYIDAMKGDGASKITHTVRKQLIAWIMDLGQAKAHALVSQAMEAPNRLERQIERERQQACFAGSKQELEKYREEHGEEVCRALLGPIEAPEHDKIESLKGRIVELKVGRGHCKALDRAAQYRSALSALSAARAIMGEHGGR